jgi:hypothetical protein
MYFSHRFLSSFERGAICPSRVTYPGIKALKIISITAVFDDTGKQPRSEYET